MIAQTTDWVGKCHDCSRPLTIRAIPRDDGIHVNGGAVFDMGQGRLYLKCTVCYQRKPFLTGVENCIIYAGVVPINDAVVDRAPDDYLLLHEK